SMRQCKHDACMEQLRMSRRQRLLSFCNSSAHDCLGALNFLEVVQRVGEQREQIESLLRAGSPAGDDALLSLIQQVYRSDLATRDPIRIGIGEDRRHELIGLFSTR